MMEGEEGGEEEGRIRESEEGEEGGEEEGRIREGDGG